VTDDFPRIGVDLGGTKIEAVSLTGDGSELARRRLPTPTGDYQAIIGTVARLVGEVSGASGDVRPVVGVGHPGTVSPSTGLIKNSNTTALNGKPLDRDLEAALGRQVVLRNDADCFALSEATDGAAAGARVVFGVILGTGVGGGVVVEGWAVTGPNRVTGEWGHISLPWPRLDELPGDPCYCGLSGCVETFISGPGFSRDFERATGRKIASRDIVAAAREGDDGATDALDRYVDRLARSLAVVINVLDPEVIVLGGGMSNTDELYDQVPAIWDRYVFSDRVTTRLVRNMHGDSSGVRGAAQLVVAG
jgi:fructokinase